VNREWIRRVGVAGFIFFFAKGMAWLAISAAALVAAV
jgi:hypothetical protein